MTGTPAGVAALKSGDRLIMTLKVFPKILHGIHLFNKQMVLSVKRPFHMAFLSIQVILNFIFSKIVERGTESLTER